MNKPSQWLERAKETYKFHRSRCIASDDWNLTKTARALRRSIGSVGEDIMIAKWYKTHAEKIEKFEYACDALEFIRKEQKKINLDEIE